MSIRKSSVKLILIILLAAILRLWNLQGIPPHLRNDEAALGYNAYSVMMTGKDEHGETLPIIFQSFGDWKPGLYIYLELPFIKLMNLNALSVRLPSAIAGILAVCLTYLIVLSLFQNKKLALISAFLLAISSWHIAFSRGAWEANIGFTLALGGIYFFLQALQGKGCWIVLSALFFGLTLLTSQGAKLSSPIIVATLLFVYRRAIFKISPKILILSFFIGVFISMPIILSFFQGKVARITTLSIFSYPRDKGIVREILKQGNEGLNSVSYYLYHSQGLDFTRSILVRWFIHFSPATLFFTGDGNPQHTAPNSGSFLVMDAIFLLAGFAYMAKHSLNRQTLLMILLLLLLPLPSALAIEKLDYVRSPGMLYPYIVIIGMGIFYIWEKLRGSRYLIIISSTLILLYVFNFIYFMDAYFIHGVKKNSAWQYGYKQIVEKIKPIQNKYQKIVVEQSYEHPYIFFLFYQKYDPLKYQSQVQKAFIPNTKGQDMGLVSNLDNISFEDIDWEKQRLEKNIIYVIPSQKAPSKQDFSYQVVDEVKDLNGFTLFKFLEFN